MKTSLMAAATAAAIVSATVAMPTDENSQSQYRPQSTPLVNGYRVAPPRKSGQITNTITDPWQQAAPVAMKTTPISLETGMGARRRAALATLFLIGAAAPCVRAEGKVLLASGDC
jgi:hypothetical protein